MIAIIDYGMGNLFSVQKAFASLGHEAQITSDAAVLRAADRVVLPGVGAFGDGMKHLSDTGLVPVIHEVVEQGTPFLGICLGLQMMFQGSEENPGVAGLGLFAGQVRLIQAEGQKVPHMGWNSLRLRQPSPLFQGVDEQSYVYFVHSFHAVPAEAAVITAVTDYGGEVIAAVGRGHVQAVQFHPEKSSAVGLQMLKNFGEMKA